MKTWNSILQAGQKINELKMSSVVTIGNFDGVHRGHQAIIKRTLSLAQEHNSLAVALTFANHTESLLGEAPFLLNTSLFRRELLAKQGLDALLEVEFVQDLADMEPETFFETWLVKGLNIKALVIGHDFRFGQGGRGDFQLLNWLADETRIMLERVAPVQEDGEVISSSRIRQLLAEGRIEKANLMLGYNFMIEGEVIKGERLGRKLGYPTANIQLKPGYLLPCYGVYLVRLSVEGVFYFGVANVGIKPTFGKSRPLVEIYLFDIEINLYRKMVQVEFLRFIRPESRFDGPEELKTQIMRDVEIARSFLKS